MSNNIIATIRRELIKAADQKTRDGFNRYFKEKVKYHGVKMWLVNKIAQDNFKKIKNLGKDKIFNLAKDLFQSGYCEEALLAADWVYRLHNDYSPGDFKVFAQWIDKYIDNWAECDTFCNHSIGTFIMQTPRFINELKQWTQSENRWVRRAAAVSLVLPARRGMFLTDIFDIADKLLIDPDDMVQKGYGWMLKEASKAHQKEVFEYVMKNKKTMPRTALRYAIEKMPPELKRLAMKNNI